MQVGTYLTSKSWETRIAAGQAVEAIASNVKQWEPTFHPKQEPSPDVEWEGQDSPKEFELLSFDSFDFKKVCTLPFVVPVVVAVAAVVGCTSPPQNNNNNKQQQQVSVYSKLVNNDGNPKKN